MANYKILSDSIDAKVFENAQQKITGANLNTLLHEMVTSLGKGYQFGGLVSPADPFTAGDEKMAFLASEAGRYPSFGNFSIVDGEVALFIWDGAWRKQVISYFKNDQVYGVRHFYNNGSPDLTRIGESSLHRDLPVQSGMKRCVVNSTGDVLYYLGEHDSTKKADGTSADLSGNAGMVMVEVPEHYRRTTLNASEGYMDVEISAFPFNGAFLVPRYLVSAYEATMDRDNDMLASVANTSPRYRGGNNNADWDGTYRSLLGLPTSVMSLTAFREKARKRGTGWGCYDWNIHCDLFWLFAVEYATLNSQKEYNENLDMAGFHQGGLGSGVSNFGNWNAYNGLYPIIPCGFTNSLGNKTGVKAFVLNEEQAQAYGSEHTEYVPSYRGVENPFGHIWKWADGFLARGNGERQEFFISRSRKDYASSLNNSYESIGMGAGKGGYVKSILATNQSLVQEKRVYGDLLPNNTDGSASTFYCDYHYEDHSDGSLAGTLVGGNAAIGANDGFAYVRSSYAPSYSYAYVGSRLCWSK